MARSGAVIVGVFESKLEYYMRYSGYAEEVGAVCKEGMAEGCEGSLGCVYKEHGDKVGGILWLITVN